MTAQACRNAVFALWGNKIKDGQWTGEPSGHSGLVLSRYLRVRVQDEDKIFPAARDDLFRLAKSALTQSKGIYEHAFNRWKETINGRASVKEARVSQRLVIGLGSESPLETGLRLHHTYGVPFLPGAALKGLAAHYCIQVWSSCPDQSLVERCRRNGDVFNVLFGNQTSAGYIEFHDAWLLPESIEACLQNDVMTSHHPDYYEAKNNAPPADWDSPNPIGFLSVTGKFLLALECNGEGKEKKLWEELALKLLMDALTHWGIGSKTNAGYGRLIQVTGANISKNRPHYRSRDQVTAKRVDDPKGKGRVWFQADDAFGGIVIRGTVPNVALGESATLWVVSVSNGYNFSSEPFGESQKNPLRKR
ncbi:MAG: type III-B CRISPR module RAMP protein Cmr6 [Gammaproteobacteria bacterium]